MKCADFEYYVLHDLTETQEFKKHLDICEKCRLEYEFISELELFGELDNEQILLIDSMEERVMNEIKGSSKKSSRKTIHRRIIASITAACLLLCLVFQDQVIGFALELPGVSFIVKELIGEGYLEDAISRGDDIQTMTIVDKDHDVIVEIKDALVTRDLLSFRFKVSSLTDKSKRYAGIEVGYKGSSEFMKTMDYDLDESIENRWYDFMILAKDPTIESNTFSISLVNYSSGEFSYEKVPLGDYTFESSSNFIAEEKVLTLDKKIKIGQSELVLDTLTYGGYLMSLQYEVITGEDILDANIFMPYIKAEDGKLYRKIFSIKYDEGENSSKCTVLFKGSLKEDKPSSLTLGISASEMLANEEDIITVVNGKSKERLVLEEQISIELEDIYRKDSGQIAMTFHSDEAFSINQSKGLFLYMKDRWYSAYNNGLTDASNRRKYALVGSNIEEVTGYSLEWLYANVDDYLKLEESRRLKEHIEGVSGSGVTDDNLKRVIKTLYRNAAYYVIDTSEEIKRETMTYETSLSYNQKMKMMNENSVSKIAIPTTIVIPVEELTIIIE